MRVTKIIQVLVNFFKSLRREKSTEGNEFQLAQDEFLSFFIFKSVRV